MQARTVTAYFLFFLQLFALAQPGVLLATAQVEDAEEICALRVPSSATFKAIQKQWVQLQTNKSGPKVQKFDLSVEALEKIAKKKGSKKNNTQLLNTILDLFIATSPKQADSVNFLKPRDWEDLQLFNTKNNLIGSISKTASKSGEVYLAGLVTQRGPIAEVLERRDFIGALLDRQDIVAKLIPITQQFAQHELNLYSDTMQPENEIIKKSVEALAPGFWISKIPGATKNPAFLRFHALLTQKLAPWFWDPLTTQVALGFAVLALMPNGILYSITKDFFGYIFDDMNKRHQGLGKLHEHLLDRAHGFMTSTTQNGLTAPAYIRQQLLPPGYRLKFFLSLLNDLFFWQTNDLRVAWYKNKHDGTTAPQPKYLAQGPHYSLWANTQYGRNCLLDPLTIFLKNTYETGYAEPHTTNPKIASVASLFTSLNKQAEAILNASTSEETSSATFRAGITAVKQASSIALTETRKLLGRKPAAPKAKNAAFLKQLTTDIKGLENTLNPPVDTQTNEHQRPSLNLFSRLKCKATLNFKKGQYKIFSRPGVTAKFSSNVISYLENWKNDSTTIKKRSLHLSIVKFILWIITTYLFQLWISNKGEMQKNIKMLDSIMFGATKPGMLLISGVDSLRGILNKEGRGLTIPSSLRTKLKEFKKLSESTCTEVVALSKSPTFLKSTGHRVLDHTGEVRRGYQLIQAPETRKLLVLAIHIMTEVDCYLGFSELAKEYSRGDNQLCPVDFIVSETPFISAKNAWFPLLGKNAIGSDFLMGDNYAPNMLLTGLNGGGKSICLKTSVFLLAMAHALGWVAAQQCSMTPFSELNLHLNSLDNAADGKSRWIAEVDAIEGMIRSVEAKHSPNYFIFICGDELGDGTAAEASTEVMTTLLTAITKQKQALSFIASHLQELTKLEGHMPRIFNYRINPNRKLEPGINQTNIAMAIFEKFSNTKQKDHGLVAALANQAVTSDVEMIG